MSETRDTQPDAITGERLEAGKMAPWAWAVVDPNERLTNIDGDKVDRLICWDYDDAHHYCEEAEDLLEEGDPKPYVVPLYPAAPAAERVRELEAVEAWIKSRHNGYDAECRSVMPELKEPASLVQALEELESENEALEDSVSQQMGYHTRTLESDLAALREQIAALEQQLAAATARLAEIDAGAQADADDLAKMRDGTKLTRAGVVQIIVYQQQDIAELRQQLDEPEPPQAADDLHSALATPESERK